MILSLFLLLISFCGGCLLLKEKNKLLLFRAMALTFGVAVVMMFNLNWIFDLEITEIIWVLIFSSIIVLAVLFREKDIQSITSVFVKERKTFLFSLLILLVASLFAASYFKWRLAEPRYSTPDSGTHFLYMNDAAKNGKMSLFGKNIIEEASGDARIAPGHNATYFPGGSAVFALLDSMLNPNNPALLLQIFNIGVYAILAGYFIIFVFQRGLIRSRIGIIGTSIIILLGTFLNLVFASHSTQLLGLLFLIAFIDLFEAYLQKKESIIPSAILFAAMVITYFYWLPIAMAFVAIRFLLSDVNRKTFFREMRRYIFPVVLGSICCFGYVLVMFRLNMFQYSAADGGVAFQRFLLSDALWITPFSIMQFLILVKKWKDQSEDKKMAVAYFLAVSIFALLLALFYLNNFLISHYTAMKVLYIVVPSAWILAIMFFENNCNSIGAALRDLQKGKWIILKQQKKVLASFLLVLFVTLLLGKTYDVNWQPFALAMRNGELILSNDKNADLTQEQMQLLDRVKHEYPSVLQNGKLFILGAHKNALWAFAYSGIWPRTESLISGKVSQSELNFSYASPNDYIYWLRQDPQHVLMLFNAKDLNQCSDCNLFNMNDYEKIVSVGDNYLLKLKEDASPVYEYQAVDVEAESKRKTLPVEFLFSSSDKNMAGLSLKFQVKPKDDVLNDVNFELFKENCNDPSQKETSMVIKKEEFLKKGEKRTMRIYFDRVIENSKDAQWCARLTSLDKKTSDAVGIGELKDGTFEGRPIFKYIK